ncbi:unnamed protein product [Auanema sp. JU1783]|nr:unnamed protein product [Auanema sp. JU1783]
MSTAFRSNMYLYYFEGTVICLTNSILLFCILSNSKNRNRREFLLILGQAIADDLYAISFMLVAELRLRLADQGRENDNSTVWNCALEPALPIHDFSTPLLGLLPLASSFNFFLCTIAPFFYLRAGKVYTSSLIGVPYLICLLLVVVNYVLLWGNQDVTSAQCVATKGAAHPVVYGAMRILRMVSTLASALIYAFILSFLRLNQPDASAIQKANHRNSTITLGLVTINSIILLFVPDVLMFLNPYNILANYSTLLYSMTLSKTMINFFIYMTRYRELRQIVLSVFFGRFKWWKNRVENSQKSGLKSIGQQRTDAMTTRKSLDTSVVKQSQKSIFGRNSFVVSDKINPNTVDNFRNIFEPKYKLPPIRRPPNVVR